MPKPIKPEKAFQAAMARAYPGMASELRQGIVGLAIRTFITPGEIAPKPPLFPDDTHDARREDYDRGLLHGRAETCFTPAELLWIANAAGVDTGTSNIRPEPGALTAEGLNALRTKLKGMVPCPKPV